MSTLNDAGRTDDEERLVRWRYHVDTAIALLVRQQEQVGSGLLKSHYRNAEMVWREISTALADERETKYPTRPVDSEQHESDQSRYASECDLCETDGHLHAWACPDNPLESHDEYAYYDAFYETLAAEAAADHAAEGGREDGAP